MSFDTTDYSDPTCPTCPTCGQECGDAEDIRAALATAIRERDLLAEQAEHWRHVAYVLSSECDESPDEVDKDLQRMGLDPSPLLQRVRRLLDDLARRPHDSSCVDDTCDECDARHDPKKNYNDEC